MWLTHLSLKELRQGSTWRFNLGKLEQVLESWRGLLAHLLAIACPEASARGWYHLLGWTLRLQSFIKKLFLP